MSHGLVLSATAPLIVGAFSAFPAAVDPVDQAAAEAAVAEFNDHLTTAGWTSTGPFTQSASDDDGADGDESEFGPCLGGFERYLDYTNVHFEGETARAFSDEFEYTGGERTDEGALGEFGYAGAVVLTAEASAVGSLDEFVERLGAEETVACVTGELTGAAPSDGPAVDIGVTNEADVGVGDGSARLDVAVTMNHEGNSYGTSTTFAAARVDRSLVVVIVGGSGPVASALDPVAVLAAVVDTFA